MFKCNSIRKIFVSFLLLSVCQNLNASQFDLNAFEYHRCNSANTTGGVDYFPWSLARPFPWKDIQGMWSAEFNGVDSYFSFRVVRVGSSGRQIRIVRYNDLTSCSIVAKGTGHETNNQLNAQLVGSDGHAFKLSVGAFNSEDLPMDMKCDSTVMGMRLSNFINSEHSNFNSISKLKRSVETDQLMSGPIYKISNKTVCKQILDQ